MSSPTKESASTSLMTCYWCNKEFLEYTYRLKSGHGKFCSRACTTKHTFTGKPAYGKGRTGLSATAGSFRKGNTGEKSAAWKGGVTPEDRINRMLFRDTVQQTILQRDNYTCQICDQYGGYLQVDHIKPWAKYPELRFEESNCRTLCMACHYYVTFKRKMPKGIIWGHNLSRRIEQF